jgi:hypothetical protein
MEFEVKQLLLVGQVFTIIVEPSFSNIPVITQKYLLKRGNTRDQILQYHY